MSIFPTGENFFGRVIPAPIAVKRTNIVLYSLQSIFTYIISWDKRMFLTLKNGSTSYLVGQAWNLPHSQPSDPAYANLQIFINCSLDLF